MVKGAEGPPLEIPMLRKNITILGWTGRGRLSDLESSAEFVLRANGIRALVSRRGTWVTVQGPEPLGVAAILGLMPGVAWTAAGKSCSSGTELSETAGALARNYLRRSDRFAVQVEGRGDAMASDIEGSITSRILESVRGSRVSTQSPKVRFRAAFDGTRGAVGVEVKEGPGGRPTGEESVACLVSGGIHSSVLAWQAVLLGFRVRLVHARFSEESLRKVAGLYAELSRRADPRWLSLEVLEGHSILGALSRYVESSKIPVFGGFRPDTGEGMEKLPKVLAPLYLMPEERFLAEFETLGIGSLDSPQDWDKKWLKKQSSRRFGGKATDVSGVLDGLT